MVALIVLSWAWALLIVAGMGYGIYRLMRGTFAPVVAMARNAENLQAHVFPQLGFVILMLIILKLSLF